MNAGTTPLGPGWRCSGTGFLRSGAVPPGAPKPVPTERARCPGCPDCSTCVACSGEVPEARRKPAYALPHCYGCLPPPEPLPVRPVALGGSIRDTSRVHARRRSEDDFERRWHGDPDDPTSMYDR